MSRTKSGKIFIVFLAAVTGMTIPDIATAKERTWYKYENAHFEAYSDGSDRATRKLLEELENFRAAVLQVADIQVPQEAPKAQLFVFASDKEFREIVGSGRISGITASINGIPYMAMFAGKGSRFGEMVVRHEYAHTLLMYKNIPYPPWFSEGFSELFSTLEFRSRNREFTLGKNTGRGLSGGNLTPWSDLISEDFDVHALKGAAKGSDAYFQSWLMAHYFLLGDDPSNALLLAQYIARLIKGQPSVDAFESVIGQSVDQFGSRLLKSYARGRMKYVVFRFRPTDVDYQFERRKALQDEVQPTLNVFRDAW